MTFRLILINCVYFKGTWINKFTLIGKTIPFYNSKNDVKHVSWQKRMFLVKGGQKATEKCSYKAELFNIGFSL